MAARSVQFCVAWVPNSMADFLIIRLDKNNPERASWVKTDASGALQGEPQHGSLALAAPQAINRRVWILVPASEVLLTEVNIPVKGQSKILQAVPFALEERVAADVEQLHFAAGARSSNGEVRVAAVKRSLMEQWHAALATHGIQADAMYADVEALPRVPGTATLILDGPEALLRLAGEACVSIESDNLELLIPDALLDATGDSEDEETPVRLDVYGGSDELEERGDWLELVRGQITSLEVRQLANGALPQMASWIVTAPGINLLQGEFSRRSDVVGLFWRPWKVAASLLGALVIVMLVSQGARLWQLKRTEAQLDSAIEEVFLAAFPGVKTVRDPRSQLRQQLAISGGGDANSSEFLPMLVALGQVLKASNNTRIEGLSFRNNTLDVQLSAPDVAVLDKIQKAVADNGFDVQIQAANPKDDRVEGRIAIRGAGV